MIKLERAFSPVFLNPPELHQLTAEYKITGASVWNDSRIRQLLLELSHGKCAYCECALTIEGKYLEVDHFKCKDKYPDAVVEWTNLLPSCKRCNTTKGSHDVICEPIVNPFVDLPQSHFQFSAYRFRPTTEAGEMTAAVVGLNHHARAVTVRFQIGEQVQAAVDSARDRFSSYIESRTELRRRKLMDSVEGLLRESQPSVPYAATVASVLHKHSAYTSLKTQMECEGLWTAELQSAHDESLAICL